MSMVRTRRLAFGLSDEFVSISSPRYGEKAFGGPVYVCPPGRRAIIRDIIVASVAGGPAGSTLIWVSPWDDQDILIAAPSTSSAYSGWHGVLDAVLEENDELVLATDLNDVSWYISGAELVL